MKEIYSSRIFNWILVIFSALTLIDKSYLLFNEFEHLDQLIIRLFFVIITTLSLLSFFIVKLNKEFYSRLLILTALITPGIIIYYRFLVDLSLYLLTRTDLISNPNIHLNFIIGIILFYFSIKYSRTSKIERHKEYGIVIIIYSLFLIISNWSIFIDHDSAELSIGKTITKSFLNIAMIFIGNKLRLQEIKFKKAIIIIIILILISGML